jgi:hypothetical protein
LIKPIQCIFIIGTILFINNPFAETNNLKESYFPLVPGSYWVTQDTFFTGEAEQIVTEDLGFDAKETKIDSVKKVTPYKDGYRIVIKQKISSSKKAIEFEWFLDKTGKIFEAKKNADSITIKSLLWETFPEIGDTVFQYGSKKEPLVYDKESSDNLMILLPKWKSENPASEQAIYKFKKGVGLIGQIYPTKANRLIEYRIGTGPIIKKHWLMETPEKK